VALPERVPENGGQPRDKLMDKLVVPCHLSIDKNVPPKLRYRCIAEGCCTSFVKCSCKRIMKHTAFACKLLDDKLVNLAGSI
jgi:hypothetical protein